MATRSRTSFTTENRVILGTDGQDFIMAGAGDDTIYGRAGDDYLDGEAGNDTIYAGKGNDTVIGGEGDDLILAHDTNNASLANWGRDKVDAGAGNDVVNYKMSTTLELYVDGGQDDDTIIGANNVQNGVIGGDELSGGEGNDRIEGAAGNDKLFGGEGNDMLFGGEHADTLDGGAGDDYLFGGDLSSDVLTGGKGADVFAFGMEAVHGTQNGWTTHLYYFDRVTDFNAADGDRLDFAVAGTADNYAERTITLSSYGTFHQLSSIADNMIDGETHFAFVTDGQTGYLFADIDFDKQWDTRVTLEGITSLEKFDFSMIV